jgi:hypothetical protein
MSFYEAEYYSEADAPKEGLHLPGHLIMGEIFNEPVNGTTTIWDSGRTTKAQSVTLKMLWSTRRPNTWMRSGTSLRPTWNMAQPS